MLFKFTKVPCGIQEVKEFRESTSDSTLGNLKEGSQTTSSTMSNFADETWKQNEEKKEFESSSSNDKKCPDEKLGFIMCECGLEGVSLKVGYARYKVE